MGMGDVAVFMLVLRGFNHWGRCRYMSTALGERLNAHQRIKINLFTLRS